MPRRKAGNEAQTQTIESTETAPMPEITELTEASPKLIREKAERLTGQAFTDYLAANKGKPVDEVAHGAGFYTTITNTETNEVTVKVNKEEFFTAMSGALMGVPFETPKRAYTARKNRAPIVSVTAIGNIVVGARHSDTAGFASGDKLLVTATEGQIVLTLHAKAPVEAAEEAPAEEDADVLETDDELDI